MMQMCKSDDILRVEGYKVNESIADELRLLLNHYSEITRFVNEKIRHAMTEEEDKLFLQWLDNYEVLIFKTTKNFVEKFESEGLN